MEKAVFLPTDRDFDMIEFDFDKAVERRGTCSIKWDALKDFFGREDLLPMWVADMDFRTPECVLDAIRRQLEQGVMGYTYPCGEWSASICRWLYRRHSWTVQPEHLIYVAGIVRGIAHAVDCFTERGDRVLVMAPVYHPFFLVSERQGRQVVYSPLRLDDDEVNIDFERLGKDLQGCRAMILCNPHNPGGRVWKKSELQQIASLCHKYGVFVISDEIHADLTLPGYRHTPFATVSEEALHNCMVLMAPSKAFNMPGLASSYVVIPDDAIRERFKTYMEAGEFDGGHIFSYTTVAAAYTEGEPWLEALLQYLNGNLDYLQQRLTADFPEITMIRPQASYLVFLNCKRLLPKIQSLPGENDQKKLENLFADRAHLALNSGATFGPNGEGNGYMRLNIGCPRPQLDTALNQLKTTLNKQKHSPAWKALQPEGR